MKTVWYLNSLNKILMLKSLTRLIETDKLSIQKRLLNTVQIICKGL